jgi:catechol 2,3-dioxygenase-like lactoylglutathione lyase family enzyme
MRDYPIHPNLPAADLDRARRWYSEKLRIEPALELPFGLVYTTGGVPFLVYETPSAGTGQHTLAAWVVDDLDRVMAELRSRGVVFEEYALGDAGPTTVNGVSSDPSGGKSAWFKDSEGNVLQILQTPPGMTLGSMLGGTGPG